MRRRMKLVVPALAALLGCASSPVAPCAANDASTADLALVDAPVSDVPIADVSTADVALVDAVIPPADIAVTDAPSTDAPAVAGPYPEGPYGNREGTVLANLSWEGYVNATGESLSTELPFGPTTLQDLRGDGRGYALIHLAEFL